MSEPEPAQAHSTVESLFAHGWSASLNNSNLLKFLQRKGVANFGVLVLGQAVTMITGLLTNVIWARYMPQETYGGFKVVFNFVNIVGAFCLLGTGQAALMSASQKMDGNLRQIIRSKLLANVGGAVLILLASGYYAFWDQSSPGIALALVVAATFFPFYNIADIWTAWLNGRSSFFKLSQSRILTSVMPMVGLAGAAVAGIIELWSIVLIYFVVLVVQNAFMISQIYSTRENERKDPSIISLGRHASVAMLFGSLLGLDVVILNHKFSANEVAVYAVAQVLPDLMKSLFSVCTQLFSPSIYAGQSLFEFWRGFRSKFIILTLVFSVLGIIGFFILPKATTLLFSDNYIRSAESSKWLWLSTAVFGSSSYLGLALISTKRKFFTYATYVGYPVTLMFLYFWFSNYGIKGMVGARILAGCVLCGFYCFSFWLMLKLPPRNESKSL